MPTEKPRFTVTVTEEMLKALDDFRYEHRYPTRTRAVNELFRLGIAVLEKRSTEQKSVPDEGKSL
ncbi:MAG: ribbon-helix-helix domain-containing protein [Clostridiales bacterium]|jgi:metal-responsive CopG/Arc/MetJ family transcriptional regulator|nr:ribbon-helix-helix domain-containing protein [Clostridiales bacterium]